MSRLNEKEQAGIRKVFGETASIRRTAKQTGHSRKAVRRAATLLSMRPKPGRVKASLIPTRPKSATL